MSVSQSASDHGEFVPDRQMQVHHEPHMERIVLYCKMGTFSDGTRMYSTRPQGSSPFWMIVAPMEEPPVYLVIGYQEAEAIAEALRPSPQVNERHLDDAITVRDRLLTLVEAEKMVGMPDNDRGVTHIGIDAELRRHPQVRIR